ncbi:MAG: hypothetical protein JNM34_02710 [Chthonomonadaceae bacterium]|jgi:hypothetical protein|nr:hypothetical protein [Chthonomonadaceae bacterium]
MDRAKVTQLGFNIALVGCAIVALTLVPAFSANQALPWPLLLGSTIYLAGGLLAAMNARGSEGKALMGRLRSVRLAFAILALLALLRPWEPH